MLASVLYSSLEIRSNRTSPEMRFFRAWYKSSFMGGHGRNSLVRHLAHAGLRSAAAAATGFGRHVAFGFGTSHGENRELFLHACAVAVRAVGWRIVPRDDAFKRLLAVCADVFKYRHGFSLPNPQ